MKRSKQMGMMLAVLMAGGAALAATSYVVPWYANPTLKARLDFGVDAFAPRELRLGADGESMLFTVSDGLAKNVLALQMSTLANATGIATNKFRAQIASSNCSAGDAPLVAVNAAKGKYFAIDPANACAAGLEIGCGQWVGRRTPVATTFSETVAATSFAFDAGGNNLFANCTEAGSTGRLVRWAYANDAFTRTQTIDTGLAVVNDIATYTIRGVEYAVVGEGDAAAATKGQIRLVKLSDGSVTTAVNDAAHITGGVKAVRMSHTDDFRPRVYVLLGTGDVVVYWLKPEVSLSTFRYSKTLANDFLLTKAAAPWSGEHAKVSALEVATNAAVAVLGYRRNADDETEAVGRTYLAVLRHTAPSWTYYSDSATNNPSSTGGLCLSDGRWILKCTCSGSTVSIGTSANAKGDAWDANGGWDEFLDLSAGTAKSAVSGATFTITHGWHNWSMATNGVSKTCPRVVLHSPNYTLDIQAFKFFACGGYDDDIYEEGVFESTSSYGIPAWCNLVKGNRRVVMKHTGVTSLAENSLYTNNSAHNDYCEESDYADWEFPALKTVNARAVMGCAARGRLTLPSAETFLSQAFYLNTGLTELSLSETKKTLNSLGANAFGSCSRLKRVTLGCAEGCAFSATSVFAGAPLEEVIFTGAVPTFSSTAAHWPDTAEKTIVFAVPRGHAAWEALIADVSKVKSTLTVEQQKAWRLAHPDTCIPFGVLDKSVLCTKYDQYIAYNDTKGGCALQIDKDDFFDDTVTVTSDWGVDANGKYMPGTTVTLTATEGATGTFVKWYGDVAGDVRTNKSISIVITNDVWLYCRFVHPWTLAADKKTASNGNFTINCSVYNESAHTLRLANYARYGLYADVDCGHGVCDLGGAVMLAGDATPWKFVNFNVTSGTFCSRTNGKGDADTLVFPGTMTSTFGSAQCFHTGSEVNARSLRTVIFDEPDMTGDWGGWTTCGESQLTRLILELPKLNSFNGDGGLWAMPLTDTKFDWWNLSGMKKLQNKAWGGPDWDHYAPARGTLRLPSMRDSGYVSGGTACAASLVKLRNVEAIELGGIDKQTTVTNLVAGAFSSDASLRRLKIHNAADIAIGANLFSGGRVPDEITFTGPAISAVSFSNLLSHVSTAAVKPVKVYVSSLMPGWMSTAYIDYAPAQSEKDEAPGERVIGVYRGVAAAPNGKALIVYRAGPYDPKNTILVIR